MTVVFACEPSSDRIASKTVLSPLRGRRRVPWRMLLRCAQPVRFVGLASGQAPADGNKKANATMRERIVRGADDDMVAANQAGFAF